MTWLDRPWKSFVGCLQNSAAWFYVRRLELKGRNSKQVQGIIIAHYGFTCRELLGAILSVLSLADTKNQLSVVLVEPRRRSKVSPSWRLASQNYVRSAKHGEGSAGKILITFAEIELEVEADWICHGGSVKRKGTITAAVIPFFLFFLLLYYHSLDWD